MLTTLIEISILLLIAYGVTPPPKPKLKKSSHLAQVEGAKGINTGFLGLWGVAACQVVLCSCLVFRNVIGGKLNCFPEYELIWSRSFGRVDE